MINEDGLEAAAKKLSDEGWTAGLVGDTEATDMAKGVIEAYFDNVELDGRVTLRNEKKRTLEGRTAKVEVGGFDGYITVNCFPDGKPGEVFLHEIGKEGSTVSGLMQLISILISVSLQYGVPMKQITRFMIGMKFEPSDTEFDSIPDCIGKYLEANYADSADAV